MFLVCGVCKHSTPYPVSEGAPEENLLKCRKTFPEADKDRMATFPTVKEDWECNNYQKEMGSG